MKWVGVVADSSRSATRSRALLVEYDHESMTTVVRDQETRG